MATAISNTHGDSKSLRRDLRHFDSSRSSSEVNWLIDGLCCKRLPAVDLTHVDLTRGEQRPEQHRRSLCRWQYGLRFDPALELFVQAFDRVRCSRASPLARRQAREGEEAIASFLQTIGDGSMA